jgi:hypothetical protein
MSAGGRQERRQAPADVEIGAVAKMKAIRFDSKPETEVTIPDSDQGRSGTHTERHNLPDEVEPGVTYRNAAVRWQAKAVARTEVSPELQEALDEIDEDAE